MSDFGILTLRGMAANVGAAMECSVIHYARGSSDPASQWHLLALKLADCARDAARGKRYKSSIESDWENLMKQWDYLHSMPETAISHA